MMINALNHIRKINTELITFSDDMDGLRKVPDNIPNSKILHENLGKPLTDIPDPFKKYKSFGEHNNKLLIEFLNRFKFDFVFKSSTENYKKGIFNIKKLTSSTIKWPGLNGMDLAKEVSTPKKYIWNGFRTWTKDSGYKKNKKKSYKIVAIDYDIKKNILRYF